MSRLINLLLAGLWVGFGAAQEQGVRSLIESASKFPPVDEKATAEALHTLKEMPEAEALIWDFVENAEVHAPFHVENALSTLERADLVGELSIERSRNILRENLGLPLETSATQVDGDPELNSFGFGTPTGDGAEALMRQISLVSGSIGLLGRHGSEKDIDLISEYQISESQQVRDEASRAIETIRNRYTDLTIGMSKEETQKTQIRNGTYSTEEEKPQVFDEDSSGRLQLRWVWVVGGISVLGILILLIRAVLQSRAP